MEYPLIDTGMGDAPTAAPTPRTSMNPAEQFDPEAFKLLEGVSPLTIGVVDSIADYSNRALQANDLITAAKQGKTSTQRAVELAESRRQMELERSRINLNEADPTAMNQAFDNVAGIMGNAPAMPQMRRPELSDTERLGSLLAGAIGGGWEGAGMAQNAAYQGAGIRADRENRIAQQNFEAENGQWMNKLRVAQQQANNQSNIFNQAENRNQRQYTNEIRLMDGRIAKNQQDIEDVDKEISGYVADTQKMISEYTKLKGEMTDADVKYLSEDIAKRERAHGLPPGYIAERMMMAPVGWKSAAVRNQEFDNTLNQEKLDRNELADDVKQTFAIIKYANMDGQVTENDRKSLTARIRRMSPKYADRLLTLIPDVGTDWRKAKSDADSILNNKKYDESIRHNKKMESAAQTRNDISQQNTNIAGAREDRMAAGGGDTSGSGLAPGNVTPQGVSKWKLDFIKSFKDSAPEQFGPGSVKTSTHKEGKGLDLKFKDAKKNTPDNLRVMFNHAKEKQVPYIIFDGRQYKLDPKSGGYSDSKYTGPSDHTDHVHIDWHPWDNKGGKPSGMGIPKATSVVGDGTQRTQAQIDKAPSRKSPATPKPVESKPDAKKEQKPDGMIQTSKSRFKKNKR